MSYKIHWNCTAFALSIGTRKKSQYVPEKGCISIDVLNLLPMIIRNDYKSNPIYDIPYGQIML